MLDYQHFLKKKKKKRKKREKKRRNLKRQKEKDLSPLKKDDSSTITII